MGRALLAVVLCACYAPSPRAGAPCDDTHPCPTGQTCNAGFCDGPGGGPDSGKDDGSGTSSDGGPNDLDGDGVANTADNCPMFANAGQGNEDADALGDGCDPCPIDANNADGDGDGVGDACDPRPATPGDSITLFEGFHAGVPSTWQVIGSVAQAGDSIEMVGVAGNRGAITTPTDAPTSGVLSAKVTVVQTLGNGDAGCSLTMPYDAVQDRGIFCELYSPDATSSNNRDLSLYDAVVGTLKGSNAFGWQTGVDYTFVMRRTNSTSYQCAITAPVTQQVSGTSNSVPAVTKAAVFTYSTTARVAWMMVVSQ